ncbi:MAG: YwbE family protein [Clostridia bacterium]|nr:YwbE family protein [Clostridia bacterium]
MDLPEGSPLRKPIKTIQESGMRAADVVADLLTKSAQHPHGIKVRLEDGQVGRVKNVLE